MPSWGCKTGKKHKYWVAQCAVVSRGVISWTLVPQLFEGDGGGQLTAQPGLLITVLPLPVPQSVAILIAVRACLLAAFCISFVTLPQIRFFYLYIYYYFINCELIFSFSFHFILLRLFIFDRLINFRSFPLQTRIQIQLYTLFFARCWRCERCFLHVHIHFSFSFLTFI